MLLLVVLALLAIFGLIAVAFVVLTGHAQHSADTVMRIDQVSDPPKALLQQVLMQVLHGPTTNPTTRIPNPASVIGAHSLLEDMYGNGWVSGTISSVGALLGFQQVLGITPTLTATLTVAEIAKRGGCVLTITNRYRNNNPNQPNPCYGKSTRIVALDDPSTGRFLVLAFPDNVALQAGDTFTINGVPFSGTGFGYVGGSMTDLALKPNDLANRNPLGGANPDYTAADFQHILLAAQVPDASAPGGIKTLPSGHRPALINYWINQTTGCSTIVDLWTNNPGLCRSIMLRPIGKMAAGTATISNADHPDFTGSNPNTNGFDPINGPWDVDNAAPACPTAFGSIWACRSARRPTAICTSRCWRFSASISTAAST